MNARRVDKHETRTPKADASRLYALEVFIIGGPGDGEVRQAEPRHIPHD